MVFLFYNVSHHMTPLIYLVTPSGWEPLTTGEISFQRVEEMLFYQCYVERHAEREEMESKWKRGGGLSH